MVAVLVSPFVGRAVGGYSRGVDAVQAKRALRVFGDLAHSLELRSLPSGRSVVLGGEALVLGNEGEGDLQAILADLADGAHGVYWLLNPCTLAPGSRKSAKVGDIVCRRWFLIDIDPVRPSGTSSSEIEHACALGRAERIRESLTGQGWPAPVVVDSGNGAHLLYRVDLPNDKDSQALLKMCLKSLARIWDDEEVTVDTAVHNASRISKLPGTWACKGTSTRERPHRLCQLVRVPDPVAVVSRSLLEDLAATEQEEERTPSCPETVVDLPNPFAGRACGDREDQSNGRAYALRALEGECLRVLRATKGDRNNTLNRAAYSLGQLVASGHLQRDEVVESLARAASGIGLEEHEIQATIHSGLESGQSSPRVIPEREEKTSPSQETSPPPQGVEIHTLASIMRMHLPQPRWVLPGILSEGLSILAGKPKLGKSFLALNLGITIAAGGKALNSIQVEEGDVLYLTLEDRLRRVQSRARKILGGLQEEASERLHICVECPRMGAGGLGVLEKWIESTPTARLIVVDVWAKFRPIPGRGNNASAYDLDYEAAAALKSLGDRHGVSVLILHHCKKAAQEDVVDEISGTLGLAGAADGITILTRARNDNEATLFVTGRDVQDQELALVFDPKHCTWTSTGSAEDRTRSKTRQRVVEALRASGGGMFASELAELLELSPGTVKKECWRMHQEGHLRKIGSKYLWPGKGGDDEEAAF